MKTTLIFTACFLFSLLIKADDFAPRTAILVFQDHEEKQTELDHPLLKFISDTLYLGKPALNLGCDVKVREMNEDRKFSDGVKRIEMLEIIYHTSFNSYPEVKMYFPVGSKVTKRQKVSEFAGTVEEIEMESNDVQNRRFIFQHNGRGEIVWMSFESDTTTEPCLVKK
ncbi:MAG: hypothetical protein ACXWQQ_00465 [Pseudobdellovibrio sp.]